ncbi:MAG: ATP-binding cassette domain-containing protein, partial [Solirubrobacteraceae bacterium]|nr:ATP-binding cassette domain-containing protein [Solirubrobacteraceae bacterium]
MSVQTIPVPLRKPAPADVGGAPESVVRLRGVRRAFGDHVVLDDLDLDIAPGEFVGVLGRSGSGKTTWLRALAGLDRGATGDLRTGSEPAVVFQDP